MAVAGSNSKARNNSGYVDKAYGEATIPSGSTSITVSHGLSAQPSSNTVMVTPKNSIGSSTKWWVSSVTSTQFTINVDVNPAANAIFAWNARIPKQG